MVCPRCDRDHFRDAFRVLVLKHKEYCVWCGDVELMPVPRADEQGAVRGMRTTHYHVQHINGHGAFLDNAVRDAERELQDWLTHIDYGGGDVVSVAMAATKQVDGWMVAMTVVWKKELD